MEILLSKLKLLSDICKHVLFKHILFQRYRIRHCDIGPIHTDTVKLFLRVSVGNRFSDDGAGYKAALLSGPPGVGKTTTATLVCKVRNRMDRM